MSESSWETTFNGDKFVTGVATLFETASGDNESVPSGCALWNETDSLNSVLQSQKLNLPRPFHIMKAEEEILKARGHQFWKDFCLTFFQASWEVELLIIFCNVAVLIVCRLMQVKVPVVGAETFPVLGELWEERRGRKEERKKERKEEEEEVQSLSGEVEGRKKR